MHQLQSPLTPNHSRGAGTLPQSPRWQGLEDETAESYVTRVASNLHLEFCSTFVVEQWPMENELKINTIEKTEFDNNFVLS